MFAKRELIPEQISPFSSYPVKHSQKYDPAVFVQFACKSHGAFAHSLTSVKERKNDVAHKFLCYKNTKLTLYKKSPSLYFPNVVKSENVRSAHVISTPSWCVQELFTQSKSSLHPPEWGEPDTNSEQDTNSHNACACFCIWLALDGMTLSKNFERKFEVRLLV